MLGSVTVRKACKPRGAERQRRLLLGRALLLHQRDQLAGDEGEGDEDRGQHDARARAKMIWMSCVDEPGAEQALGAEHQHVDQARRPPARPRTAGRSG